MFLYCFICLFAIFEHFHEQTYFIIKPGFNLVRGGGNELFFPNFSAFHPSSPPLIFACCVQYPIETESISTAF